MAQAIKFLHTSDVHLDRVIDGLLEIAHLKAGLANAAYLAAENVFTLALAERVDFVLISGDLVDLDQGGPRAAAFVQTQLERLAEKGIAVYWCGGKVDQPDRWPSVATLPANVVSFSSTVFERRPFTRGDRTCATIYGTGYFESRQQADDLRVNADDEFPIVLAYSPGDVLANDALPVRYWALGGDHVCRIVECTGSTVVHPGTPQARSSAEQGAHLCALVKVDVNGNVRVGPIAIDVVRWSSEQISFAESASDEEIRSLLADRALQLAGEMPEQLGLVTWEITTTGEVVPRLRHEKWCVSTSQWLRTEFGAAAKGLWSVDFKLCNSRRFPPSWHEEDTMLGDYLRAISRYQADPELPMNLHGYMPSTLPESRLSSLSQIDSASRAEILQAAALVGVERLGVWSDTEEA